MTVALQKLKDDFGKNFHADSVKNFFKSALKILLDIIRLLVESAVAIGKGITDYFIAEFSGFINSLLDENTGLLATPIEISFFSWLYETLTGDKLSILSLMSLVIAIPVTVLYRVISGNYPSQDLPAPQSQLTSAHNPPSTLPWLNKKP